MRRIRAGKKKLFYRSNLFFLGLLPALHFGAMAPQAPTARRCRRLARRRSSVMRNDNTLRCVCALLRAFRRVEMNEFSLGFFVHPSIFFPSWKYKLLFLGNLSLSLSLCYYLFLYSHAFNFGHSTLPLLLVFFSLPALDDDA